MNTATLSPPTTALSVIANRAELLDALSGVVAAVKSRTPQIALKCVHMEAVGKSLVLTTSNGELRLRRVCDIVQIQSTGIVLVDCASLLEKISAADSDTLTMTVSGEKLHVDAGEAEWKTAVLASPESFPPEKSLDDSEKNHAITLPIEDFRRAVDFVMPASDKSSAVHYFKGICFEKSAGTLNVIASDGHWLATTTLPADKGEDWTAIISADSLASVLRSMPDEGDVSVTFGEVSVQMECEGCSAWMQRIEGALMPWRDVIPQASIGGVDMSIKTLLPKVRQAALAVSEESKAIRMEFAAMQGLVMSARGGDESSNVRHACKIDGDGMVIGINARLLINCLSTFTADGVKLEWNAPNRPMKFTAGALVAVVLPINLTK